MQEITLRARRIPRPSIQASTQSEVGGRKTRREGCVEGRGRQGVGDYSRIGARPDRWDGQSTIPCLWTLARPLRFRCFNRLLTDANQSSSEVTFLSDLTLITRRSKIRISSAGCIIPTASGPSETSPPHSQSIEADPRLHDGWYPYCAR